MRGDGCEGAVEEGEASLEEADRFHGGGWMWFLLWCCGFRFCGAG